MALQLSEVNLSQAVSSQPAPAKSPSYLKTSRTSSKATKSSKSPRQDDSAQPITAHTNRRVHLISDHSTHLPRSIYASGAAKLEKDGRATLYSAVKRVLSKSDIVILDSGNYIKGWRYQLHCEAKNLGTASCVVHVGVPPSKCTEVNEARLAEAETQETASEIGTAAPSAPYERAVHAELLMRFEEPNPMARWDIPLFTIPWEDGTPPNAAIWVELVEQIGKDGRRKTVKPNAATMAPPSASSDHLYELDRTTQAVISRVQEWQRERPGEGGGSVEVEIGGKVLELDLPVSPLSVPQLQRLRRQFIALHRNQMGSGGTGSGGKGGGGLSRERVGELFVGFLESQWGG